VRFFKLRKKKDKPKKVRIIIATEISPEENKKFRAFCKEKDVSAYKMLRRLIQNVLIENKR